MEDVDWQFLSDRFGSALRLIRQPHHLSLFELLQQRVHNLGLVRHRHRAASDVDGVGHLFDVAYRAINETGARLSKLPEAVRPGLVIFVVMTDGEENSSKEFTKAQIKSMIQKQTDQYNWQFTFLGADQNAFAEAAVLGINADGAADFKLQKVGKAYQHTGNKVARMRKQMELGQQIDNSYTPEERADMA